MSGQSQRMVEAAIERGLCALCWKPTPEPHGLASDETGMPVCEACAPNALACVDWNGIAP
ncbi:hypothetical protein [Phenylobacterium sp.]|uniref:hypothetical protein n=1 Tax=Phenylobacterium sp. TaxID=1871053 RepID=UPI002732D65E|nr:hypothetical protein [Phenylobacterium sp.]MDP3853651.1 hypothetical protein [Phenylobacterium sp.]